MAFSGVRSSWLILARNFDFATLADFRLHPGLVGSRFLRFQLLDEAVLLRAIVQHGESSALQALDQKDEVVVDADGDDSQYPVEGISRHEETQRERSGHRHRTRIKDRHDGSSEQHPDRGHNRQGGEQKEVRGLVVMMECGEGKAAQQTP